MSGRFGHSFRKSLALRPQVFRRRDQISKNLRRTLFVRQSTCSPMLRSVCDQYAGVAQLSLGKFRQDARLVRTEHNACCQATCCLVVHLLRASCCLTYMLACESNFYYWLGQSQNAANVRARPRSRHQPDLFALATVSAWHCAGLIANNAVASYRPA